MSKIPQDFLDIDPKPDNWVEAQWAGKGYIVPTDERSDMTDAMMSEIPGLDDTVQPLKLRDNRFWGFCMAFLNQWGNLAVPGGRYGTDTRTCSEVAIAMGLVMQYHNGEPMTYYSLRSDMGQVVNSGDDVAKTLSESGYILDEHDINVRELLGDAYLPQTPIEKLAHWAEEIGGLLSSETSEDGSLTSITILVDDDDAEALSAAEKHAEIFDNP
jgi:hypothetical protein